MGKSKANFRGAKLLRIKKTTRHSLRERLKKMPAEQSKKEAALNDDSSVLFIWDEEDIKEIQKFTFEDEVSETNLEDSSEEALIGSKEISFEL